MGFTVILMFGLQHHENEHVTCFLVSSANSTFMPTIQGGYVIISTMIKTNSALNTSDIKLISTKYYSIRTIVINRREFFFKVSR